jgi:hypothetical protein
VSSHRGCSVHDLAGRDQAASVAGIGGEHAEVLVEDVRDVPAAVYRPVDVVVISAPGQD